MPDFHCLRCGTPMRFAGRDKLQLGKTSWLFGDLPNLMAGALEVSIMACPACGKRYELDSPKCPFCGEKNTKLF